MLTCQKTSIRKRHLESHGDSSSDEYNSDNEPPRTMSSKLKAKKRSKPTSHLRKDDDSISSSRSISRKPKKKEIDRKNVLENDGWVMSVQAHVVVCKGCNNHISLGKNTPYALEPWKTHKKRCAVASGKASVNHSNFRPFCSHTFLAIVTWAIFCRRAHPSSLRRSTYTS